MSSINEFLTNKNLQLIWEVIKDYDVISDNKSILEHINIFIQQNVHKFYEIEKLNVNNLKEINKKFIIYIIKYINNYLLTINNNNNNNINTNNNNNSFQPKEKGQLITFEEIQNERKSNFEKQLLEKQKDFSEALKKNIPETPIFSDKLDGPLSETEKLVEKMKQQRFLEEETFKNTSSNTKTSTSSNENNNWLSSKETSIKKEKNINIQPQVSNIYSNNNYLNSNMPIKYIKIENEIINNGIEKNNIIDLDSSNSNDNYNIFQKKHITWNDENITINIKENNEEKIDLISSDNNIFSKLKKINTTQIKENNSELELELLENSYPLDMNISSEVKTIKDEMKIIHTKMNELDATMNNVLTFLKSKNISLV